VFSATFPPTCERVASERAGRESAPGALESAGHQVTRCATADDARQVRPLRVSDALSVRLKDGDQEAALLARILLQEQRGLSGQAGAEGECDARELRPSVPQAIQDEENGG